ncbi:hypothetical protein BD410DRAFT_293171 [Rickenella mellea]|uniref:Protein kinase domain-containing protein n=1 Tax=Rickenella mellea TaxID=50990 RepID=A0A4Y7Q2Q1_9AGAM|nr:hypothetical protein BD410DRAFT_293171 [Rickenella mellea]
MQAHCKSIEAEAKAKPASSAYDPDLQEARGFPFVTSYKDNGQEVGFTYDAQLDENKLVFSAILGDPHDCECFVTFAARYSETVHSYLASGGYAPALRRCIRISSDWTAVVMDKSKYKPLFHLSLSMEDEENARRKVKSIVQTLHEAGFVHGDVRDINILIDPKSLESDDVKVHLIDFDWAGRIGEAKYPIDTTRRLCGVPTGLRVGRLSLSNMTMIWSLTSSCALFSGLKS